MTGFYTRACVRNECLSKNWRHQCLSGGVWRWIEVFSATTAFRKEVRTHNFPVSKKINLFYLFCGCGRVFIQHADSLLLLKQHNMLRNCNTNCVNAYTQLIFIYFGLIIGYSYVWHRCTGFGHQQQAPPSRIHSTNPSFRLSQFSDSSCQYLFNIDSLILNCQKEWGKVQKLSKISIVPLQS